MLIFNPRAYASSAYTESGMRIPLFSHVDLCLGGLRPPQEVVLACQIFLAPRLKKLPLHGKNQVGGALYFTDPVPKFRIALPKMNVV